MAGDSAVWMDFCLAVELVVMTATMKVGRMVVMLVYLLVV